MSSHSASDVVISGLNSKIGTFRLEYEYEIYYEYHFSKLVLMLWIITFHTDPVPVVAGLKFESGTHTQI